MSESSGRLKSLDVLRGFDMFWIIGSATVVHRFCGLFDGGNSWWLFRQFTHVKWEGLHFYDMIFPLFVFIAGVSFPFSYAKQAERGASRTGIVLRILRRAALLVLLGMVYNGVLAFDFSDFRYASVLGKIGIAWAVAALVYVFCGLKGRIAACAVLLGGYAALLHVVAPDAPPGAGPLSPEGCFPGYLDRIGFTPGAFYIKGQLEPSGFPVSFFGSASAMLGMFAGDLLRSGLSQDRKVSLLALAGVACAVLGWIVALDCPVIKKLWTPSFSLVVGGYSFLLLAFFYWIVDVRGHARPFEWLSVIGMNAVTIYMAVRIVDFRRISKFLFGGIDNVCHAGGFVESIGVVVLCWLLCWFLHRNRVYLKI